MKFARAVSRCGYRGKEPHGYTRTLHRRFVCRFWLVFWKVSHREEQELCRDENVVNIFLQVEPIDSSHAGDTT